MTPPKPSRLACEQCGQPVPSTARNHAYVLCAGCIPPQFQPSRRRLTQAEWDAELKRARGQQWCASCQTWTDHYDHQSPPLRTRTGRRRSWWQRGWKR